MKTKTLIIVILLLLLSACDSRETRLEKLRAKHEFIAYSQKDIKDVETLQEDILLMPAGYYYEDRLTVLSLYHQRCMERKYDTLLKILGDIRDAQVSRGK